MILLIDNYDSFVYNLARYFQRLGQRTNVVRNREIDVDGVRRLNPKAVVFSPGPCAPEQAGCSIGVVRELHHQYPMLGVCLGHQSIAAAMGGRIVRAAEPVHGRASQILHDGEAIFAGIANPLTVGRYHSLVVDDAAMPSCLEISARTIYGTVMAIRHRKFPVIGVQFHPESILTQSGYQILANFCQLAGLPAGSVPADETERSKSVVQNRSVPLTPVPY